ncbi:MAG: hypothetical protein LUD27_01695 [Clostridia bacterium]|nr:hypothetical protein [Clostridia bacterium]
MAENNTEEIQEEKAEVKPEKVKEELTSKQKNKKFWLEVVDLLRGAAFSFIVMCVFSSLIIVFMTYTDEFAVQLLAVVGGEAFVIGSLVVFGRSNGAEAYKVSVSNEVKRKAGIADEKVLLRTGEYAPWKGFVIGLISSVPFIIMQTIDCFGDFDIIDFLISYACGWASAPFDLIGNIPDPYYFFMVLLPVAVSGGFYIYGKSWERKRQQKIKRAEDDRRKGKKKHYYEENDYGNKKNGRK